MLHRAICMSGAEAARVFYDNERLTRREAMPPTALTLLQRVVHLVEEAQSQKSRAQRFSDRFVTRYSPAVLRAAVLVAVVGGLR